MTKTTQVRIAVEVGLNDDGKPMYQAYGASGEDDWGELMSGFDALQGEVLHLWVTAEVPLPETDLQEIAGQASEPLSQDEERSDTASPLATEVA